MSGVDSISRKAVSNDCCAAAFFTPSECEEFCSNDSPPPSPLLSRQIFLSGSY